MLLAQYLITRRAVLFMLILFAVAIIASNWALDGYDMEYREKHADPVRQNRLIVAREIRILMDSISLSDFAY
jgi:hypothetical protein